MKKTTLALAVAAAFAVPAHAVRLDPDGLGQALVYPYYTAQASNGSPYNTYVSITNHAPDGKALRVRFREARSGQEVAAFNLFLARNDAWAGAVIPHGDGARLITADVSCTDPAFTSSFGGVPPPGDIPGITFSNAQYVGNFDDGAGTGLDRTREGWVEVLEMATLAASSLAYATHNAAGLPVNCGRLREDTSPNLAPPSGGLAGTLTLIEVNRGFDFTVKAEALAELSTQPFFRRAADPYPSFDAGEVTPLSLVTTGVTLYRSEWRNGIEAVSAVLMRSAALAEFVLDSGTRSGTDVVLTFPTRYRGTGATPRPPFSTDWRFRAECGTGSGGTPSGERLVTVAYDRNSAGHVGPAGIVLPGDPSIRAERMCASATVMPITNVDRPYASLLSSPTQGYSYGQFRVRSTFSSGMLELVLAPESFSTVPRLASLGSSTRYVASTGTLLSGPHTFTGLPVVGLMVRSFENGTLNCGAGSCQGNYGGAFPLSFRRSITP